MQTYLDRMHGLQNADLAMHTHPHCSSLPSTAMVTDYRNEEFNSIVTAMSICHNKITKNQSISLLITYACV